MCLCFVWVCASSLRLVLFLNVIPVGQDRNVDEKYEMNKQEMYPIVFHSGFKNSFYNGESQIIVRFPTAKCHIDSNTTLWPIDTSRVALSGVLMHLVSKSCRYVCASCHKVLNETCDAHSTADWKNHTSSCVFLLAADQGLLHQVRQTQFSFLWRNTLLSHVPCSNPLWSKLLILARK